MPYAANFPIAVLRLALALILSAAAMADVTDSRMTLKDASDVTWAHAVNSRSKLDDALNGEVDFIEADISMGHLAGKESGPPIPIMAHPPDVTSDISLEQWLDMVIARETGKGVKLDFKFIEAVEPTLMILRRHERKVDFPLWLNADILPGPVNATQLPVSAKEFIRLCRNNFPDATLSVGWTTYWFETFPPDTWQYGWNNVRAMADVLTCSGLEPDLDGEKLTFPVRAVFAVRSIPKLRWLLDVFPSSALTVWSGKQDSVEVSDLLQIRKSFKLSEVYYDVPERLRAGFDSRKSRHDSDIDQQSWLRRHRWITVKDTSSNMPCQSKPYISSKTMVFGKNSTVALITGASYMADDRIRLRIQGKVTLFSSKDDGSLVSSPGEHQLVLSLVDEKVLPAYDGSQAASDATLKAMNDYKLHEFRQSFDLVSQSCHYFRLDTFDDRMFQAWTVPCDLGDDVTEDGVAREGVAEIPRNKRLVLPPGPVKLGFVSTGNGYVVVEDLEVKGVGSDAKAAAPSCDLVVMSVLSALVTML